MAHLRHQLPAQRIIHRQPGKSLMLITDEQTCNFACNQCNLKKKNKKRTLSCTTRCHDLCLRTPTPAPHLRGEKKVNKSAINNKSTKTNKPKENTELNSRRFFRSIHLPCHRSPAKPSWGPSGRQPPGPRGTLLKRGFPRSRPPLERLLRLPTGICGERGH